MQRVQKCCISRFPRRYSVAIHLMLNFTVIITCRYLLIIVLRFIVQIEGTDLEMAIKMNASRSCKHLVPINEEKFMYKDRNGDLDFNWPLDVVSMSTIWLNCGDAFGSLIGGILADRFGGKHIITVSLALMAIISLGTPSAIWNWKTTLNSLRICQGLMGFTQGLSFTSTFSILGQWTIKNEIASMTGFVLSGYFAGLTLATGAVPALIIAFHDWRIPFLFIVFLIVIALVFWVLFGTSYPKANCGIGMKERLLIQANLGPPIYPKKIPMKKILLSCDVWVITASWVCYYWFWMFIADYTPTYRQYVLHYQAYQSDFPKMGGPYILAFMVVNSSGFLSQFLINKEYMSMESSRKLCQNISVVGSCIYILGASYAACDRKGSYYFFLLSRIASAFYLSGTPCIVFNVAPNFAGTVVGVAHFFASFASIILPNLQEWLFVKKNMDEFNSVMWFLTNVSFIGSLIFGVFVGITENKWNNPRRVKK